MATDFVVGPVRNTHASRALAEELREAILAGKLGDGEILPSERDMAGQADVSRGSVREALRALEAEGLIEVRSGRNGGAVVRVPGPESLGRPVAAFIRGAGLDDRPLAETLLVLEPAVAAIAAEKRTDEDLVRLRDITDRLETSDDHAERVALNAEWHVAIGDATHNGLLAGILNGLAQAIHAATDTEAYAQPGVLERAVASYRRMITALEAHDATTAEQLMFRHVSAGAAIAVELRERG
jgi:GntR family transcriptional regulator, transcriptional repressor for pyruvate dehydrogenase complex